MHLPTQQHSRINEIDAIRAIALLGILMMNIMSFAGAYIGFSSGSISDSYTGVWNERSLWFINSFVTSSFITMFSFLFGLGFYLFFSRAQDKTDKPSLLFVRRLVILLIIGILHGIFIWYGDILTQYAITGFWLLLFVRAKPIVNLVTPIVIFGFGTMILIAAAVMMNSFIGTEMLDETDADMSSILNIDLGLAMSAGSYMDIVGVNTTIYMLSQAGIIITMPIVLAMFLLGLYVGQKNLHVTYQQHMKKIIIFGVLALVIGLLIKLYTGYAMTYSGSVLNDTLSGLSYTLGGPLTALGYTALFLALLHYVPALVRMLQPAGQMALTNYLMQSVVMVAFFRLSGLYDSVDAIYFVPISIGVFAIQVVLSHIWMRYFTYGPFEWLWRMLTYMKRVPIRRQKEV